MVETITPVVHGGKRGRWIGDVALHVLGAAAVAATFGAVLGGVGALLGAPWGGGTLVVLALAVLYLAREAFTLPVPVPQARRQVPDWWRTFFPRPVFAFLYGAGLGIGFVTFLSHGTLVVVSAAAVGSGRPALGALVMAPFGLVRGASVVASAGVLSARDGAALVERLAMFARGPALRVVNSVALAGLAFTAAWAGARGLDAGAIAGAALAVVFAWAFVAKAVAPRAWRSSLAGYGLPPVVLGPAAVWVPVAEGAVAVLVVAGFPRVAGALALSLLVVFSVAILRARAVSGDRIRCGCFAGARTSDYRGLLARNGLLAVAAVVAVVSGIDRFPEGARWPGSGETLPAALAAIGSAVAGWALFASGRALRRVRG